ncbi:uncharacterized protein MELLADRAFT_78809 [Melampsora larici-populina 98AG31]|uniref:Uncharacterized protein n=1 Tax=Melampsora larici-populina (strain 98AG31 / pathotype 3-4-7) TaxID=747676 RepID=F4RZ19_MELLP|nr:uncharacterized protein MELLADRAFT_78809 [Melampsora larici-populina 98AG31]EGG02400.1 hypothetical protein MELLADRAFT_78809 [Melampsora larici-populina 98AG31]
MSKKSQRFSPQKKLKECISNRQKPNSTTKGFYMGYIMTGFGFRTIQMSQFALTGPEASSSQPSLLLEQQPEFDITDAFAFDDMEVEEESTSDSGFTLPSLLRNTKFEFRIPKADLSPPIHRRIIELRTGIPFNLSHRKKQKTKVKEVREKKTRNQTRLSPLSQPISINLDPSNEEDSQDSMPLFVLNLEAFTCLNNPYSKPQKWTTHPDQGLRSKNPVNHSKPNRSLKSSCSNLTTEAPLFNFGDLPQRKLKGVKRKHKLDSNQNTSGSKKRPRQSCDKIYPDDLNPNNVFQTFQSSSNPISTIFTYDDHHSSHSIDFNSQNPIQSTSRCMMIEDRP